MFVAYPQCGGVASVRICFRGASSDGRAVHKMLGSPSKQLEYVFIPMSMRALDQYSLFVRSLIVACLIPLRALDQYSLCARSLSFRRSFSSTCGPLISTAPASVFLIVALPLPLRVLDQYSLCARSLYCRSFSSLCGSLISTASAPALFTAALLLPLRLLDQYSLCVRSLLRAGP